MTNRDIKNFELDSNYYLESYLNGNKTHVKEELAELYLCNRLICMRIISKLPDYLRTKILESEQMNKADIKISLNQK